MKSLIIALLLTTMTLGPVYAQDEAEPAVSDRHAELEKVKAAFKETWVHPDADFKQYGKVYLWEGQFEYRDVGPARRNRSTMMSTRKREYGISDADRQKFEDAVADAFVSEIQKGKRFTIVDEVGPDTIIMRGGALDIISRVPPEMVGPGEIYLASIGEATFIMELIDAETGDVLAVVSERRTLGQSGGIDSFSMPTSSVSVIADVKRWARSAAAKLRSELDKAIAGK
jgi:hypothetical protein